MADLCQCATPGPCPRYGRDMTGRFWEICQGINVDAGTAAAFRDQWGRETGASPEFAGTPRRIALVTNQCAGDTVAMTAALYSLHRTYPGRYITTVASPHPEVWEFNPDVSPASVAERWETVQMHYPAIHDCNNRAIHFMAAWCEFLSTVLGCPVPIQTNRPRLYFPSEAIPAKPESGDYWVICSGGKRDFTNKLWGHHNYQEVVRLLHDRVRFVQVGSMLDNHQHLDNTEDRRGKTNLRELFNVVRHARGVLCGVSLLMHVAAALERPAVVIAGGREPVQWNAYPKQHYLHTVGMLPCTCPINLSQEYAPCWRSRVQPLGDQTEYDRNPCLFPLAQSTVTLPKCMTLIEPKSVAKLILRYNEIEEPRGKI